MESTESCILAARDWLLLSEHTLHTPLAHSPTPVYDTYVSACHFSHVHTGHEYSYGVHRCPSPSGSLQGFSTTIKLPRAAYLGYIKEYEGAKLMEVRLRVCVRDVHHTTHMLTVVGQREAICTPFFTCSVYRAGSILCEQSHTCTSIYRFNCKAVSVSSATDEDLHLYLSPFTPPSAPPSALPPQCELNPRIPYTQFSTIIKKQKEVAGATLTSCAVLMSVWFSNDFLPSNWR